MYHKIARLIDRKVLFWWQPNDNLENVGDYVSRVIVSSVLTLNDKELAEKTNTRFKLLSTGSILHFANTGDCIWGSGRNGNISDNLHKFKTIDVRAVRGPLTRDFLQKKGLTVPEIYGDPAILLPIFFGKNIISNDKENRKKFVIVPHMSEPHINTVADHYKKYVDHLVSPRTRPIAFVRKILNADFVISASLHGIILAESYGIPAIYLNRNNAESIFKYNDYYYGTDRSIFHMGKTVEECLEIGGNPLFDIHAVQKKLLAAFPIDLWTK